MHESINFIVSLPTLVITCLFYFSHHSEYEMVFHGGFHLHFPVTNDIEHLFIWLFTICIPSLGECLFKLFSHVWLSIFYCWVLRQAFIRYMIAVIFSNIMSCLFAILIASLKNKGFSFGVQFLCTLGVVSKRPLGCFFTCQLCLCFFKLGCLLLFPLAAVKITRNCSFVLCQWSAMWSHTFSSNWYRE